VVPISLLNLDPMNYFAVTTRGLETLCAEEMSEYAHLQIQGVQYRRVSFAYAGSPAALLEIKTADDVYLHLATWTEIVRQRDSLMRMETLSAQLDLDPALLRLPDPQRFTHPPRYSVTASFVGKRNYTVQEIKQAVVQGISGQTNWVYQENDLPGAVNLRIFMEGEQAWVGLRLSNAPLHQRAYKQENIFGSTKPSVAAAMVREARQIGRAHV
jgi:tRNA (guanine6-N2)-methyltransferase